MIVRQADSPPREVSRCPVCRTDLTLTCETHPGAPRLSGAPLAATNGAPAGAICKRRDAVMLGRARGS